MEIIKFKRKVNGMGNTRSLSVVLPFEWVMTHGIKQGDTLALALLSNGELLVRPTGVSNG